MRYRRGYNRRTRKNKKTPHLPKINTIEKYRTGRESRAGTGMKKKTPEVATIVEQAGKRISLLLSIPYAIGQNHCGPVEGRMRVNGLPSQGKLCRGESFCVPCPFKGSTMSFRSNHR